MSVTSLSIIKTAGRITVETLEVLVDILSSPWSAYHYCDAVGVPPFGFNGEWTTSVAEIRKKADAADHPEQWAEIVSLGVKIIDGIVAAIRDAPGPSPSLKEKLAVKIVVPVLLEVSKRYSPLVHALLALAFFTDQRLQDSLPQGLIAERWCSLLGNLAATAGWGHRTVDEAGATDTELDWAPLTTDLIALVLVLLAVIVKKDSFNRRLIRFWYGFDHPQILEFADARRLAQHAFTLLLDTGDERFSSDDLLAPLKPQPAEEPPAPLALTLVPVPKAVAGKSKLYVQMHGQANIDEDLGAGFHLKLTNGASFGLLASQDSLEPIGNVSFQAELVRELPPPSSTAPSSALSFHLDRFAVGARANLDELSAWLRIEKGVISVLGGTWLDDYVPQLRFTFDVTAEASVLGGVRFQGGAGGEVLIPINQRIPILVGSARVESVHLRAYLGDDEGDMVFRLEGAANLSLSLFGVLTVTIDGIGASYSIGTATQGHGNLSAIAKTGWNAVVPHGAGLELKVGNIVGGGALFYDVVNDRLSGAVDLRLSDKLALTGLGIYQRATATKPRSWLLLASLVRPQSGSSFTIEGVGALYGSNRTTDPQAFLTGILTGDLDAVLFPEDPIGKAAQYLAALERLFPSLQDASVMGISAKLSALGGMLTLDLGVILNFEASTLVRLYVVAQFVGLLKKPIPGQPPVDPEKQAFRVLADGVAIWDRKADELNLRIALRNSRVWVGELTGGASLFHGAPEADDGEHGTYIAIGGFHPDYVPPGTKIFVPPRLSLVLSKGDHFKLEVRAYAAFTPSSLQFGLAGALSAQMYGFGIRGLLAFDVLIAFDGDFNLHLEFSVELLVGSHSIAAVRFVGSLVGFSPTILAGKAEVKFLFWTLSVSGSLTIHGEEAPEGDVDVTGTLTSAISEPSSWDTGGAPGLTLTDRARDGVWLSPSAPLRLRQPVVPLNVPIERFGSVRLRAPQTLRIEQIRDDVAVLPTTPVTGEFALGMFLDLTQEEMLASRGFESRDAGVQLTRPLVTGVAVNTSGDFEEILIDPRQRPATPPPVLDFAVLSVFAASGGAAASSAREPVRVRRERFAVVNSALQPQRAGQTYFEARAALEPGLQLVPEAEFAL